MATTALLDPRRLFEQPVALPPSVVRQSANCCGVLGLLAVLGLCTWFELAPAWTVPAGMLGYALPIFLLDHAAPAAVRRFALRANWPARLLNRTIAHYLMFAVLLLLAWALPWYQINFLTSLVNRVGVMPCVILGVALVALTPAWLLLADSADVCEQAGPDGALSLGQWIAGQRTVGQADAISQFVLGWAIKFIFVPLMLQLGWDSAQTLSNWPPPDPQMALFGSADGIIYLYEFVILMIFLMDYCIVLVGYLCTVRLLGTQVRSADRSGLGWAVCLACYGPLWLALYPAYLAYGNESFWQGALENAPLWFFIGWAVVLVVLSLFYLASSAAFGLRFSNLTHRGLITNGPYRWFKHPAYVSKNLTFWLVSVPFLPTAGWAEAARTSLLLLLVNALYVARALTEQNHLRADPDYVAYEAWMAQHSVWAKLRRMIGRR